MTRTHLSARPWRRALSLALVLAGGAGGAMAQSNSTDYSLLPYTTRGYVGLNLGQSDYDNDCSTSPSIRFLSCDRSKLSANLYTGGMFNEYVGVELGYLHMGRADREGGRTTAQGVNASVVGRLPIGSGFGLFAKGGATYGRTRVDALASTGVPSGKDSGWGGSYGAGLSYDLARNGTVVLEWQHHDFNFAGVGRQGVQSTSLGYLYRF